MPNKMERFTNHSRWILLLTQEVTEEFGLFEITPSHLLLGMTRATDTYACEILAEFDIISSKLAPFVKAKQPPAPTTDFPESPQLSDDIKRILEVSVDAARRRNDHFIGTPHLLMGLLRCQLESIETILHHFDVESKAIIKFTESYLDDGKAEEVSDPVASHPHYETNRQIPKADNLLDVFRSIWRNISNRKDDK